MEGEEEEDEDEEESDEEEEFTAADMAMFKNSGQGS